MKTETIEKSELEEMVTSEDPVLEIIKETLPTQEEKGRKYWGIKYLTGGGTRDVYTARWGPKGKQVVIKVDKKPKSKVAIRHVERGYNTERELQIASGIENPEEHNIVRLRDYYQSKELKKLDPSFSGTITIEDYFPGKTLKEIVGEKPLNASEFEQVFGDVIEAERYLINDESLLHRDLNKNNILIKKDGRMSARVTDLTNACDKGETSVKTLPTSGSMSILDPTTCEIFMGKDSKYKEESELYAIGKNMLFSLTGIDPVEYDPDKGTAVNTITGESLLDENGLVNTLKHERAIEIARSRLPSEASRYDNILRRSMSLSDEVRYHSIDELIRDFNNAKKPTTWEKIKKHKFVSGAIFAGALTFLGALGSTAYNFNKNTDLESKLEESKKYQVAGKWNGEGLEITNNLANLNITAYVENNWGKVYPDSVEFISAKPGQKIWGYVKSKEISRPEVEYGGGSPALKGRVYIEGYEGKDFVIWPKDVNEAIVYEHWSEGVGSTSFDLQIPENIPEGAYVLAAELYAGDNSKNPNFTSNEDKINFTQPEKIIARKRVPIVIGNPENKAWLRRVSLNTGYGDNFTMARIYKEYDKMDPDLKYEVSIPEDDTTWTSNPDKYYNSSYQWIRLKDKKDTTTKTLQVVVKNKQGEIVGYNFAPIYSRHVADDYYVTDYAIVGKEWSDKLPAYRKAIYGDRTEADSIRNVIKNERLEREKVDSLSKSYNQSGSDNFNLGYPGSGK